MASIATAAALIYTIRKFLRTRKTEQIKLGDKFFSEPSKLRKEMDDLREKLGKEPEEEGITRLKGLDWRIFNTLEWNAFLVNEKEITDKK